MNGKLVRLGTVLCLGFCLASGALHAQQVVHLGEFCFTATDAVGAGIDPGNAVTETRAIRLDVLAYNSTTLALHGIVVDTLRTVRFTVAGSAF